MGEMRKILGAVSLEMRQNFDSEYETISAISAREETEGLLNSGLPDDDENLLVGVAGRSGTGRPIFERTDSGNDSLASTWNQSNFIFLQPHQYARLGEKLNRFSPADVKTEALNTLLMTQLADVVGSGSWEPIRDGLQSALLDSNSNVSGLSVKIHARLLSNISPMATKEAFANLVGAVMGLYKDKTRWHGLPTFVTGLAFKKKVHFALSQVLKLITDVNCDLPKFWIRYPEKHVHEIVQNMVSLVGFGVPNKKIMTPLNILALCDPQAKWLKFWLHGGFGRKILLKKLGENDHIVKSLANLVAKTIESKSSEDWTLIRSSFRHSAKGSS